jgi:uncharacterized protein
MLDIERRALPAGIEIETREDGKRKLRGHAAVFNALSEDLGGFREQIAPGAFADAIGMDDVRLLINHEGLPLARNLSGTLKLGEDARGLTIEADLDEADPDVLRLLPKLLRGDVNQMSFGFSVRPGGQDWAKDDEGRTIRTLKKLRLFDVSVVTYPAYTQTDVAVRELRTWEQSLKAPTPYRLMQALERQASI